MSGRHQPTNGADSPQALTRVVRVVRVNIPAMSTIGYGEGFDQDGNPVRFAGDHRPMRHLGEAIAEATRSGDDAPTVELELWQIL